MPAQATVDRITELEEQLQREKTEVMAWKGKYLELCNRVFQVASADRFPLMFRWNLPGLLGIQQPKQ